MSGRSAPPIAKTRSSAAGGTLQPAMNHTMSAIVGRFHKKSAANPATAKSAVLYLNVNAIPNKIPGQKSANEDFEDFRAALRASSTNAAVTATTMNVSHCERSLTPFNRVNAGFEKRRNRSAAASP